MRVRRSILLLVWGFLVSFSPPFSLAGEPSAEEQLWLQMINRFRADPAAELDHLVNFTQPGRGTQLASPPSSNSHVSAALRFFKVDGAVLRQQFNALQPAPPLAWSSELHDSATSYSLLTIERDLQSHGLDGLGLIDRITSNSSFRFDLGGRAAENIYAYTHNVVHGHAGFVLDWGYTPTGIQNPPGHRNTLIDSRYREVGIAMMAETDGFTSVGPNVVTQHFATDLANGPYLVGAIFTDTDGDEFYSVGEGRSRAFVELLDPTDLNVVTSTRAFGSGGYRLDLTDVTPGRYHVRVHNDKIDQLIYDIDLSGQENVALDLMDPHPHIDALTTAMLRRRFDPLFDLDRDRDVDQHDRRLLIEDLKQTYFGDINFDRQFDSTDLVLAFQASEYEDRRAGNSVWTTGDWNGDGEFDSADLIVAFQQDAYEQGPRAAAALVPEPDGLLPLLLAFLGFCLVVARQRTMTRPKTAPVRVRSMPVREAGQRVGF